MALAGLLLVGCGGGDDTALEENEEAIAGDMEVPVAVEAPAAAEPQTIAELFPEGEGREIVLNNCASCHAVACAAIGQRPASRWQELASAHAEHVPSLSAVDRETAFAYLAANFGADRPEPNVPPQFLERGCTPF